jgi:hypothetical protein
MLILEQPLNSMHVSLCDFLMFLKSKSSLKVILNNFFHNQIRVSTVPNEPLRMTSIVTETSEYVHYFKNSVL